MGATDSPTPPPHSTSCSPTWDWRSKITGTQSIGAYRVECDTVSELLYALKKQGVFSMMRRGRAERTSPRIHFLFFG